MSPSLRAVWGLIVVSMFSLVVVLLRLRHASADTLGSIENTGPVVRSRELTEISSVNSNAGGSLTVNLFVPWGKKETATKITQVETISDLHHRRQGEGDEISCPGSQSRCVIFYREREFSKFPRVLPADSVSAVVFDSVGKKKDDIQFCPNIFNVTKPLNAFDGGKLLEGPSRRKDVAVVLWNTENWSGRAREWGSKYRVRWLNHTDNPFFWSQFDLVASFESTAAVHVPASHRYDFLERAVEPVRRLVPDGRERQHHPAVACFIASNCHTVYRKFPFSIVRAKVATVEEDAGKMPKHRNELVQALMAAGFAVDSYGACLHNRDSMATDGCEKLHDKKLLKFCAMRRHLFYLSFENSIDTDYVTEKVYEPLAAGAIPVYVGAENVDQFLPTDHVVIKASSFGSADALVLYLRCVAKNASVAAYYLGWRQRKPFDSWAWLKNRRPLCNICDQIGRMKQFGKGEGVPPPVPHHSIRDDRDVVGSQAPLPCS